MTPYITHLTCHTPITLRRVPGIELGDVYGDSVTLPYCQSCDTLVPHSELSSAGPFSAVLPEDEGVYDTGAVYDTGVDIRGKK